MGLLWTLILLGMACVSNSAELPKVNYLDCSQIPIPLANSYDKCLQIAFSNRVQYAGLHGSETVLTGSLLTNNGHEDDNGGVSVTKDDDDSKTALVMISEEERLYKMEVDLETGESEKAFSNEGSLPFDDAEPNTDVNISLPVSSRAAIEKSGYIIRVQFVCDSSCKKKFRNPKAEFKKILAHSNTFFSHKSLGTRFKLVALPTIKYISQHLRVTSATQASSQLRAFSKIVHSSNWPDADSYSVITVDDDATGGRTVGVGSRWSPGMASIIGTCGMAKYHRVNINEYQRNAMVTAQTLVHEIGHNLGMAHDFNKPNRKPRFTSDKKPCTGIGGYMDYGHEDKWSPCSREDFQNYFDVVTADKGGCFCLSQINGKKCEPEVIQPSLCADKLKTCKKTTECGKDQKNINYLENCRATCGHCPYGGGSCTDLWSNCPAMASSDPDMCKFGNTDWVRFKRFMCRKSCNLCKKDPKQESNSIKLPPCVNKQKSGCNWRRCRSGGVTYQEKCMVTCGICRNGAYQDQSWAGSYCQRHATSQRCKFDKTTMGRQVRLYCRKTCKSYE